MNKVVILGFGESAGTWTNPQWMAYSLKKLGYDVVYVNPPATRKLQLSDIKRIFLRLGIKKPLNAKSDFTVKNVYTSDFINTMDVVNILTRNIKKQITTANRVICFQPIWLKFLKLPPEKTTIFVCDDYSALNKSAADQEKWDQIANNRYKVCVTSSALVCKHPDAFIYANAVPVSFIDNLLDKHHPKKVAGSVAFVGTLHGEKLDQKLTLKIVTQNPDKNFVFAGKVFKFDLAPFEKLPNFIHMGEISYDRAITLMCESEFGLIPFELNNYTRGIFSMKYFEYLYCGCKVVTTKLPMYEELPDLIAPNKYIDIDNPNIENLRLKHDDSVKEKIHKYYSYNARIENMRSNGLI